MNVCGITNPPVRLVATRLSRGHYRIEREGLLRGEVQRTKDGWWRSMRSSDRDGPYSAPHYQSFKTAVLALCRDWMHDDGPWVWRPAKVSYRQVGGEYFVLVRHQSGAVSVYEEYPTTMTSPSPHRLRQLRRLVRG